MYVFNFITRLFLFLNLIWYTSSCTLIRAWVAYDCNGSAKPRKITRKMYVLNGEYVATRDVESGQLADRSNSKLRNNDIEDRPDKLGILLTRIVVFNFKPETLRVITGSHFAVRVLNYRVYARAGTELQGRIHVANERRIAAESEGHPSSGFWNMYSMRIIQELQARCRWYCTLWTSWKQESRSSVANCRNTQTYRDEQNFSYALKGSRQHWAGVCLGSIVSFQKGKLLNSLYEVEKMISVMSVQV